MKNYSLLALAIILCLVHLNLAVKTCNSKCFCPCRISGGGKSDVIDPSDVIYPNQECLNRIKCTIYRGKCSDEIIACAASEAAPPCFCPCRIPHTPAPNNLCYPNMECLQRIKCVFGSTTCTPERLNDCVHYG